MALEEACQKRCGILLFCNRTPVAILALCFLGAFSVSALSLILVRCFSRFRAFRFCQIAQQSLSVSGRPRRCPSLFFLQQKSLEVQLRHSHLYRLHQVVRLCSFQEQGRHHSPIFQSSNVPAAARCHEPFGFQPRKFTPGFAECLSRLERKNSENRPMISVEPIKL